MAKMNPLEGVAIIAVALSTLLGSAQTDGPKATANDKLTEGVDETWLKTVVSIERTVNNIPDPRGTGFIVTSPKGHLLLVTAKHVVRDDEGAVLQDLVYRVNRRGAPGVGFLIDKGMSPLGGTWRLSKTDDVAVRFICQPDDADLYRLPTDALLLRGRVRAGAPVIVAGYPLGMISNANSFPVLRRGIVSMREAPGTSALLVDAELYPGNSGGPVFYVPTVQGPAPKEWEMTSITDIKVLGLVSAARPWGPQYVGLTYIVPSDAILDLMHRADVEAVDGSLP
jgi:hypothetical protein